MSYDAILVARRGADPGTLERMHPRFREAVYHAVFAERSAPLYRELEAIARLDTSELTGDANTEAKARRTAARQRLPRWDAVLFPPDERRT